jgi:hypothetical protein
MIQVLRQITQITQSMCVYKSCVILDNTVQLQIIIIIIIRFLLNALNMDLSAFYT